MIKENIKLFSSSLFRRSPFFLFSLILFFFALLLRELGFGIACWSFVLSVFLIGYKYIVNGFFSALKLKLSEESLISFSSVAAVCIGEAFEAFLLLFFFIIGETLEDVAKEHSRKNITELSQIVPNVTNLFVNNNVKQVDSSLVKAGDYFFVYPFEKIPCDGIIIEGKSKVNNSFITGESELVDVFPGEEVPSGSINTFGSLKIKAINAAAESAAGRILKLIEKGTKNKAKTERFISKFSRIYMSCVFLISFFLFVFVLFFCSSSLEVALRRSMSFMVASCPCSIVISVPLALFQGIGESAKKGILFKGSKYLEQLNRVNVFFFDKTGTLTENRLKIDRVYSFSSFTENEVLSLFAAVEAHSKHPIAEMFNEVRDANLYNVVENVAEFPGYGVKAKIGEEEVICGNLDLLKKNDIQISNKIVDLPIYIAMAGKIIGGLKFKSKMRDSAAKVVEELAKLNIRSVILSGDSQNKTEEIAKKCKIKEFYFSLLPENKLEILNNAQKRGYSVAFLGDGANDAPSLAAADCGIAMGLGSDIALESAGIVLKNSDIALLPHAVKISKRVINKIRNNVAFAICVKIFVLFFSFFSNIPLWLAVFADVGVTIISVLNSTKIRIM